MREIILLKAILGKSSLAFLWFCLKLKFHHAESFNSTGENYVRVVTTTSNGWSGIVFYNI